MKKILQLLKISLEVILVICFIFFEELIWKTIVLRLKEYIIKFKILTTIEQTIKEQNPYTTLTIFLLPLGIAELMGIYSGMLFISGSMLLGAIVYALKIPIATITFWIFSFSKEKLFTIDWFKTLYDLLMRFINFIQNTEIYKSVKLKIKKIKAKIKKIMKEKGTLSKEMKKTYDKIKSLLNEEKNTKENK